MKKSMHFRTLGLLGALLAILMVLAGCGGSSSEVKNPKELTVAVQSFADTLEPTDTYYSWVVMRYGIGETLTKFDKEMHVVPWLAKEWKVSEDGRTWTITIDDKAKFSNGKKVTGEAVKSSIERVFEKSKRPQVEFFKYEEITTDGDKVMIRTAEPVANLMGCLADPLFIIVDTTADQSKWSSEGPVATGPYVVTSFTAEKTVLKRNENYWDGNVPFDKVTMLIADDPNVRALSLQQGEADMAVNIATADLPNIRKNDKLEVHEIASLRTVLAHINMNRPALSDLRVRQAIVRALDRVTYADVLLKGGFTPGKAPVPPSLDFGFDQLKDENAFNVESAKKLLAEAGWKDTNGDGIVDKDGKPLELHYVIYASREELPVLAEATQASLREIGIKVHVDTYEYSTLLKMHDDGEYDLLIWNTITANTGDPYNYIRQLWYGKDNSQNTSGFHNEEVDQLLDKLATEFDPKKRREAMIQIQQIIMNEVPAIFYAYPKTNVVSQKYLKGVEMYPADYYWVTKDIHK